MLILPDEIRRTRLISDEYRKLQESLHKNPAYGCASRAYADIVSRLCNDYEIKELLDYGAGKGVLGQNLKVDHAMRMQMYDPAMPDYCDDPEPTEMVACIDVLEHIEPSLLYNVLDDLKRVTKRMGIFTVCTEPAIKTLDDGRNAHLIIEPAAWWLPKIMERFDLHVFQRQSEGFLVLVQAQNLELN